ncbi:MAG: N-acetylmuramoyl-L-alanine amidase [Clostridia bacterium]|nr:N-acetylmuramoyl-L-alanine amidase [Clostridia bacterium]
MKNRFIFILIFIISVFWCITCCAQKNITVKIDGDIVKSDVSPVIVDDRVLVPARSIFEYMGSEVKWNDMAKIASIIRKNDTIHLIIDNNVAVVNGQIVELDVPAKIINGRTMIPVRFVSENLNMEVEWDQVNRTVNIYSKAHEPEKEQSIFKGSINKISVSEGETYVKIKISGAGKLEHSMLKLDDPKRYVYDFKSCMLNTGDLGSLVCSGTYVKSVRWSQYNETTCRVVVDLQKYYFYDYVVDGDDVYIVFDELTPPAVKPSVPDNDESIGEMADKFISGDFTKLSSYAKNKLVIIDPGHGGSEVGTIGMYNGKEIYEKDVNIDICIALEAMLKKCGVSTYMLRDDDTYINISKRPEIANEKDGYFYLCVHNNASENPDVNGVQVYYSETAATFDNMTNREVSKIYYDNIAKLGLKKSGMVDNPKYIVIYKSKMPAIIVENAFMSNPDDLELLMDDEFKVKLAAALCESTIQILNKTTN